MFFKNKGMIPVILFFVVLFFYVKNLSRSVYGGDVGDLVTSAAVIGVPHPPGYPLFTLLGHVLLRIIQLPHLTPAFIVGLISSVSSALAVVLYYLLLVKIIKNRLIALIGSLTLAFTFLFWFYAEIAEVFALNNFFVVLLLYLSYLYRTDKKKIYLYLLSFSAGLSLTNHHTIVLIFPSLLLLIGKDLLTEIKKKPFILLKCLGFVGLGFLIYVYVIVASLKNPVVDWANIKSYQDFIDLVLRRRYGTFQLSASNSITMTGRIFVLKSYLQTFVTQLTIPAVVFSVLGIFYYFKKDRIFTLSILLAFILTGPFFITYAGFPLASNFFLGIYERFLSISTVVFLLFFPIGVSAFANFISRFFTRKEYGYLFQAVFLLIPFMLYMFNLPKTNLSNIWIGDKFADNYLNTLPPNGILFLSGDTNLFNTWYMRYAVKKRPDTEVFNGIDVVRIVKLYGKKYNKMELSDYLSILDHLSHEKPIFSDIPHSGKKLQGKWIPYGLYYQYRLPQKEKMSYEEYKKQSETVWKKIELDVSHKGSSKAAKNFTIADISSSYTSSLIITGNYFLSEYQKKSDALEYYMKALDYDPSSANAHATIGVFYTIDKSDCIKGLNYLRKSIELAPIDLKYYYFLYSSMLVCGNSDQEKKEFTDNFKNKFGVDFIQSFKDYSKSK